MRRPISASATPGYVGAEEAGARGARRPLPSNKDTKGWIRFDRNELAGSFGDIGTDLPLLLAMIPAAGLNGGAVFLTFGLMQIATGLLYGLPMPVQPLKAMAVLVISQKLGAGVLLGGAVAIGGIMLVLAASGALDVVSRAIPRPVVRGIQFGLGLKLAALALGEYVPSLGPAGYVAAGCCFAVGVALWENRRWPSALIIIGAGLAYALVRGVDGGATPAGWGAAALHPRLPTREELWTGLWLLAIPQIPLSLSNAVIATRQTVEDLFPERRIGIRRIGLTYAAMNLTGPLLGGVPACHGCGGLAGHHAFGARTGGSVIIYGCLYVTVALLFGPGVPSICAAFPMPVLGVILLFESAAIMRLVGDVAVSRWDLTVALLTGVMCLALPQGFVVGLVAGTAMAWWGRWRNQQTERHGS